MLRYLCTCCEDMGSGGKFHLFLSRALCAVNWSVIIPRKESQLFGEQGAGWTENRLCAVVIGRIFVPLVENRPTYRRYLSVTVLPVTYRGR
jgi:hypothetical protein